MTLPVICFDIKKLIFFWQCFVLKDFHVDLSVLFEMIFLNLLKRTLLLLLLTHDLFSAMGGIFSVTLNNEGFIFIK